MIRTQPSRETPGRVDLKQKMRRLGVMVPKECDCQKCDERTYAKCLKTAQRF